MHCFYNPVYIVARDPRIMMVAAMIAGANGRGDDSMVFDGGDSGV